MAAAVRVAATLPLKRRRLGLIVIGIGVVLVILGLMSNVTGQPAQPAQPAANALQSQAPGLLQQVIGKEVSIISLLGSTFNSGLASGGLGKIVADLGLRLGTILVVLGAVLVLLTGALPPLRGFVGAAAGLGLMGCAVIAGVLFGENARLSNLSLQAVGANLSTGWWFCCIGFVGCVAGGAVATMRPLAGVASAVGLAVAGVGMAISIGLAVGADKLAGSALSGIGLLH